MTLTATPAPEAHPLDDVVWAALTGPHAPLAEGDAEARRYPADIAPFGAVRHREGAAYAAAVARLAAGPVLAFVTPAPLPEPAGAEPVLRAALHQMLLTDPALLPAQGDAAIEPLGAADLPAMMALVQATRPGPFGPRTIEMGDYVGVRDAGGALVAMAGERMMAPGFTEISAVCVDPACRGRGLAAALIRQLARAILARGETPFLHVVQDNHTAIALYQRIGFRTRRPMHFAVFRRAQP